MLWAVGERSLRQFIMRKALFATVLAILAPAILALSASAFLKEATQELHIPATSPVPAALPKEIPDNSAVVTASTPLSQAPHTKSPGSVAVPENTQVFAEPQVPLRLSIPAISLSKAVLPVGLAPDGAMDVLNNLQAVGWYLYGAKPGERGSAVMDAHVYQAFGRLKELSVGDEIFTTDAGGTSRRFVITERQVYEYDSTRPLQKIFNRSDAARLNLITCYGDLLADGSTYTHRLVIFAELRA